MKHLLLSLILLSCLPAYAQKPNDRDTLQRKFSIILDNETDASVIKNTNKQLDKAAENSRSAATRGLFSDMLDKAYKTAFQSKTVNASSNLFSYTVSTLAEATRSKRNDWYNAAKKQCRMQRTLTSEARIDDFYALPSVNGAMDPQNMKFKGFGLQHYLANPKKEEQGIPVFKIFCKVKTDEEGIQSIVNHGKFLVDIDEFWFKPLYCGLPYDTLSRDLKKYDFKKRKDLRLDIKVKIYSSWINEAIMLNADQKLGEFLITAKIEENMLNKDSVFVYDKTNPKHAQLVSLIGDCFMVPRSFTGTSDARNYNPSWGTGQYRVEMELVESCAINDDYYTIRESGNAERQVEASLPGKTRWDKSKWKTEWTAMQKARRSTPFWKGALNSVLVAYRGSGWIQTFTDPLATTVAAWETQELAKWLELTPTTSTAAKAPATQSAAQGATQSSAKNPNANSPGSAPGAPVKQ